MGAQPHTSLELVTWIEMSAAMTHHIHLHVMATRLDACRWAGGAVKHADMHKHTAIQRIPEIAETLTSCAHYNVAACITSSSM